MIHVPTALWLHTPFDLAAWAAGAAVGFGLYRWRLSEQVRSLASATGPGYFLSLPAGAALGITNASNGGGLTDVVLAVVVGALPIGIGAGITLAGVTVVRATRQAHPAAPPKRG